MNVEQAIQVLKTHNEWRRGAEIEQTNPKELGKAIDLIIKYYENNNVKKPLQRIK